MGDKISVRNLKKTDIEDLVDLAISYYGEVRIDPTLGIDLYLKMPSKGELKKQQIVNFNKFERGESVFLVAELNGKVIGRCDIETVLPNSEVQHVGSLAIGVSKEYRNRGIGTKLIEECLKKAKAKFKVIKTDVYSNNYTSKKLLRRFNFRKTGIVPNFRKRRGRYQNLEIWCLIQ